MTAAAAAATAGERGGQVCMIPWPENGTKDRHSDSHSSSEKDEPAPPSIILLFQNYGIWCS
jgi:hypothetical protein